MEPAFIEVNSFSRADLSFLKEPRSASPDPPPGLEVVTGCGPPGLSKPLEPLVTDVLKNMSKAQANKLVEDISKLETNANIAEIYLNWCNQPNLPHHNAAWGVHPPCSQPWHHAQGGPPLSNTPRTTVMLKNVPSTTDRDSLEEILRRNGFDKKFNLLYAPGDWNTGQGRGFAFVNMTAPEHADALMKALRAKDQGSTGGTRWWSEKAQVAWAYDQGLDNNLRFWQNHQVMHAAIPEKFKPAYFVEGQRRNFPEPTKSIKKPRIPGVPTAANEEYPEKILSSNATEDTTCGQESSAWMSSAGTSTIASK